MTDSRVSRDALQVLVTQSPDTRVSRDALAGLVLQSPDSRVSRDALQVLVSEQSTGRSYLRTVGSVRAVQMKQPDGSWWPVQVTG